MSIQTTISTKLSADLAPTHLEVLNESDNHSVPPDSETHFKVVVVSAEFDGQMLIRRHRRINALLADELANGVHALSLHTFTPQEWQERQGRVAESPACRGGSKAD